MSFSELNGLVTCICKLLFIWSMSVNKFSFFHKVHSVAVLDEIATAANEKPGLDDFPVCKRMRFAFPDAGPAFMAVLLWPVRSLGPGIRVNYYSCLAGLLIGFHFREDGLSCGRTAATGPVSVGQTCSKYQGTVEISGNSCVGSSFLSIQSQLQKRIDDLTRAEKQLAHVLMENYPASALGSITELAQRSGVSTPTVARLVQKLGFDGFPQFQQALRAEVSATLSSPIAKHENWAQNTPGTHILNRFSESVSQNIRQTFARISSEKFELVCSLLADGQKPLHIVGGRISRSLAEYLFTHIQVARPGVTHMTSNSNAWPHYILDMKPGDVLVIFDVRRYENDLRRLAEMTHERGVEIVLFTDQWGSPVSKVASHKFNCHIEVPSAWDSSVVIMLLLEAIIAEVQGRNWESTKERMRTLEELFDRTRLFRKFT